MVQSNAKVLLVGTKTDEGTANYNTLYDVTTVEEGRDLFGEGSVLLRQYVALTGANPNAHGVCIAVEVAENIPANTTVYEVKGVPDGRGVLPLYANNDKTFVQFDAEETTLSLRDKIVSTMVAYQKRWGVTVKGVEIDDGRYAVEVEAVAGGIVAGEFSLKLAINDEEIPMGIAIAERQMPAREEVDVRKALEVVAEAVNVNVNVNEGTTFSCTSIPYIDGANGHFVEDFLKRINSNHDTGNHDTGNHAIINYVAVKERWDVLAPWLEQRSGVYEVIVPGFGRPECTFVIGAESAGRAVRNV